jgi:hypothetical protein
MADMQSVLVLIAALLLVAAGCGDDADDSRETVTPVPSAEQLTGVYDSNRGLVLVTGTNRNVRIDLGLVPESSISAQGTLRDDGSIELTGTAGHQDMGISPVSGRVVVTRSPTEIRIAPASSAMPTRASPLTRSGRSSGRRQISGGALPSDCVESLSGRPITGTPSSIEVPGRRPRTIGRDADETGRHGDTARHAVGGDVPRLGRRRLQRRAPYAALADIWDRSADSSAYRRGDRRVLPMPEIGPIGAGNVIVTNQAPITSHAFRTRRGPRSRAPPTP